MKLLPYPTCCGAYLLTDFGNTDITSGTRLPYLSRDVRDWLIEKQCTHGKVAFHIAVLNTEQKDALGKAFEEAGFKEVAVGKNTSHKGYCHTFIWSRTEGTALEEK